MAVPRLLRIFKVRSEGNLEFWVSNLIIIVSTVLGVYLAALAGYKTALQFELARSEREGYFLRRALFEELKDNLQQADVYVRSITEGDAWRFQAGPDAYKLQSYVWDSMKQQSITFQLPAEILTGVRRYYDDAASNAVRMRQGQGTATYGANELKKDTQKVRNEIVPKMEKDIAALENRLRSQRLID